MNKADYLPDKSSLIISSGFATLALTHMNLKFKHLALTQGAYLQLVVNKLRLEGNFCGNLKISGKLRFLTAKLQFRCEKVWL